MKRSGRIAFFLLSVTGFFAVYLWGLLGLSPFGHYPGPYGDVINKVAVYERHATDVVSAVNFDYRAFDTLGEEFILFISVVGATLLLRRQKGETEDGGAEDETPERNAPSPSDAARAFTLALIGPLVLFGLYIVSHGQLTPGGGFQGGVILATAPLLIYLAGDFETFKKVTSHTLMEVAEALGAGGFLLIGFLGLILGGHYLQNVLPLGKTGEVNSSGVILAISLATGLEVAAGFVLLLYGFLEQTLEIRLKGGGR